MKVGMKFASFAALNAAIESYSKEKKIYFYRRDCSTLESSKKHSKKAANADPELKYNKIRYQCMFNSRLYKKKPSKEGVKQRKSKAKISRTGCEAHIAVLLTKDAKYLKVVSVSENHNHPISDVYYAHHVRSRKLNAEDREKVKNYLFLKANKKLLREQIVKETGKLITMKDLQNLAALVKREQSFGLGLTDKMPRPEVDILSHQQGTSAGIPNAETMSAVEILNMIGQETLLAPANPEIQEGGCETIVVEPDLINPEINASPEKNNNDICSFETGIDFYSEQFLPSSVEGTTFSNPPIRELGKGPTASPYKNQKMTTEPMVQEKPRQEEQTTRMNVVNFDSLKEELAEHTKIMQRQCKAMETMSASLETLVHLLAGKKHF